MTERMKTLRACALLMLTAIIWGFAMAAQQKAAQYLGPFTCNALRFLVGALTLLPFMLRQNQKNNTPLSKSDVRFGLIVAIFLFSAALCQQTGVSETGAGKAGFITALYVVLVPLIGALIFRQKTSLSTWLALLIALPGLYLLCIPKGESFTLASGDLWMLAGSVLWALHILFTGKYANRTTALKLCTVQFSAAAILNFLFAIVLEEISLQNIWYALLPILYCGAASNGLGYFLQTVGQKDAKPAHAALILSLESVFSVIGGALFMHERMSAQGYIGCLLMLIAVMLSQWGMLKDTPDERTEKHV